MDEWMSEWINKWRNKWRSGWEERKEEKVERWKWRMSTERGRCLILLTAINDWYFTLVSIRADKKQKQPGWDLNAECEGVWMPFRKQKYKKKKKPVVLTRHCKRFSQKTVGNWTDEIQRDTTRRSWLHELPLRPTFAGWIDWVYVKWSPLSKEHNVPTGV